MSIDKYEILNQERKIQQTKRKVAAYCRVSTDNEDQANSFESQQRYFRQYIERNPHWELFEVFADDTAIIGLNQKTLCFRVYRLSPIFYTLTYLPNQKLPPIINVKGEIE